MVSKKDKKSKNDNNANEKKRKTKKASAQIKAERHLKERIDTLERENTLWMITSFVLAGLFIISLFTNGLKFSTKTEDIMNDVQKLIQSAQNNEVKEKLEKVHSILEEVYKIEQQSSLKPQQKSIDNEKNKASNEENLEGQSMHKVNGIKPVDVELFVMSYCPYGRQAEKALLPAIKYIGSKYVNLKIYYIGNVNGDSLSSMHGPIEVQEDIRQECIEKYYNETTWINYIACFAENADAESCMDKFNIDKNKVSKCMEKEGKELLKKSFQVSNDRKIYSSPTLFINNQPYQGPRTIGAYLNSICDAYTGEKPELCEHPPACFSDDDCENKDGKVGKCVNPGLNSTCILVDDAKVELTIINSKDCPKVACDTTQLKEVFKKIFPNIEIKEIYYENSEQAKEMMNKYDINVLPMFVFNNSATKAKNYPKYARFFRQYQDALVLEPYSIGAGYDPRHKIENNSLKLFIMGHCPYGLRAIKVLPEVLEALPELKYEIHFIADYNNQTNQFSSMHGPSEVQEDKIMLCVKKYYPKKFLDFMVSRASNIGENWKTHAKSLSIDTTKIEKCLDKEADELLKQDIEIAKEFGISPSPTWLINNRFMRSGLMPAESVKQLICAFDKLPGCSKTLSSSTDSSTGNGGSC